MRPLSEIVEDMVQHAKDNPDHGLNCSCKDVYLREAKEQMGDIPLELGKLWSTTYRANWGYVLYTMGNKVNP